MEIYNKIVSLFEILLGLFVCFISFIISPYRVLPKYFPKNCNKLFVLGNGPSLLKQLNFIFDNRDDSELVCVNGFSRDDNYELLKPEIYFLIDPIFFKKDWNTYSFVKSTLKNINQKTDWSLFLVVPRKWKKSKSLELLSNNKNITIGYLKNVPFVGKLNYLKKTLFKFELSTPVFQNVLLATIFFGINRKYKEINLFGTDHSWLNDLVIDKDNIVYLKDHHFDSSEIKRLSNIDKSPKKAYVFINQVQIMLREYSVLSSYANEMGVRILNYTINSHIESFEKKNI